ncbi:hypothetical protein BDQ17DRAFT_1364587 [Cyathus striatus]|nr:hypothetical protein BDQ17DRAFT_1364587 [Cyathus striatus]
MPALWSTCLSWHYYVFVVQVFGDVSASGGVGSRVSGTLGRSVDDGEEEWGKVMHASYDLLHIQNRVSTTASLRMKLFLIASRDSLLRKPNEHSWLWWWQRKNLLGARGR